MGYFSKDRRQYRSLISAIKKKDLEAMKRLLSEGAPLMKPSPKEAGADPLIEAADIGFIDGIKLLIEKGVSVDSNAYQGRGPLQQAAYSKHKNAVLVLQSAGADINATEGYYNATALHDAQSNYDEDMMKFLLDHGANVNAQRDDGYTVLHIAARQGKSDQVKLLLSYKPDIMIADRHMNTAADIAQKEYPGIADLIRASAGEPKPVDPAEGWQLTATDEVSRVTLKKGLGYRLTEIFNFGSHLYTHIAQNTASGAESQSIKHFDEMGDTPLITAAKAALDAFGGKAPVSNKLNKPVLSPPGATP